MKINRERMFPMLPFFYARLFLLTFAEPRHSITGDMVKPFLDAYFWRLTYKQMLSLKGVDGWVSSEAKNPKVIQLISAGG